MKALLLTNCLLLTGCAFKQTPWHLDSIATGEVAFDSSRLVYSSASSHVKLEFLKVKEQIKAFLFLKQHKFAPSGSDPSSVKVCFLVNGEKLEELAPLREGKMRVALSERTTEKLLLSLKEGQDVSIVLEGFQETIAASDFGSFYPQFVDGALDLFRWIKGPLG